MIQQGIFGERLARVLKSVLATQDTHLSTIQEIA
jgi:hypothetical protein